MGLYMIYPFWGGGRGRRQQYRQYCVNILNEIHDGRANSDGRGNVYM